jgi:hypothetical protein
MSGAVMLGKQFCSCRSAHYAVLLIMQSGVLEEKRKEKNKKGKKDGRNDGREGLMERKAWCGAKRRCLSAGGSLQMVVGCDWRLKSLRQAVNKGVLSLALNENPFENVVVRNDGGWGEGVQGVSIWSTSEGPFASSAVSCYICTRLEWVACQMVYLMETQHFGLSITMLP